MVPNVVLFEWHRSIIINGCKCCVTTCIWMLQWFEYKDNPVMPVEKKNIDLRVCVPQMLFYIQMAAINPQTL